MNHAGKCLFLLVVKTTRSDSRQPCSRIGTGAFSNDSSTPHSDNTPTSAQPAAATTSVQPASSMTSVQPTATATSGQPAASATLAWPTATTTSAQPCAMTIRIPLAPAGRRGQHSQNQPDYVCRKCRNVAMSQCVATSQCCTFI